MLRLITLRIALGVLTLWLVSVLVFVGTQVLPGDTATAILGPSATPDRLAALRKLLHLDDSVVAQYWHWLSSLVQGDLGTSASAGVPLSEILSSRVQNSGVLMLASGLIAVPVGLGLGVWAAIRRDRLADHLTSGSSLVLAALPEFVIGMALVLLFATTVFQWLPAVSLLGPGQAIWSKPQAAVLPVAALALAVIPYITRIMRGSMIEVLQSDYVQTARLKGLPERTVILRHSVPNALVPAIQVTALQLAWLAGGVVVIEYLFSFPGVGGLLVDSVTGREITIVQDVSLLIAAVYVTLNVLADVLCILITPKVRTGIS
ncbi:MAG: peptide/nickel transport system permease protein [Thermoleophilaceae bacterium]|jgi:peptide/nickel transport system permease protein|nr:peptide/nickel transport system permease protein [Thermoleophilaceae bacterium]